MDQSNLAVLDASIAHGAARWLGGVHKDPASPYRQQYKAVEDKLLFAEFLHDVLLYDRIILDDHNGGIPIVENVIKLFSAINAQLSCELLTRRPIAPASTYRPVMEAVCQLIVDRISEESTRRAILSTPIPWTYKTDHADRNEFERAAVQFGLESTFVPFAVFVYRGLCYAGFANNLMETDNLPAVYLASPGRMRALRPILSDDDMNPLSYPKSAYSDLVSILKLPGRGYSFGKIRSLPQARVSTLAQHLNELEPDQALKFVLELRASEEAASFRRNWTNRMWEHSRSLAVGAPYVQTVKNNTVYGDLIMVQRIYAAAKN